MNIPKKNAGEVFAYLECDVILETTFVPVRLPGYADIVKVNVGYKW